MLWWLILTSSLLEFHLYPRREYVFSLASHDFIHMKQEPVFKEEQDEGLVFSIFNLLDGNTYNQNRFEWEIEFFD